MSKQKTAKSSKPKKTRSINAENWHRVYNELKEFTKKHKKLPSKYDSQKLYTWCAVQRLKKKKGTLKPEYEQLLNDINFIWNVQDYVWQRNFDLLVQYRKDHPDRWPSQRSRDELEHKLAVWFLGIRKDYKKNALAQDRIDKLNSIGFPFYPREYRWMKTYKKLEDFVKKKGRFPQRANQLSEEGKLYNWTKYQVIKMHYEVLEDNLAEQLKKLDIDSFIATLHENNDFM